MIMNESTLQIRNVDIRGFGNLGHVVMRELGDRIVLEGINGVGKTMVLTAIRAALEGKTGLPDRPLGEWVKDGHESAVIKIDLAGDTVIKFSIRVIITADDFDLQIKEVYEDGKSKKIPGGPMAFLKTIVNAIAFRPQQWRKKSDVEQCEEVFNFFPGLKEKLARNNKELSEAEQERASVLTRSKVLRLDIDRAPFVPCMPEKEIDPADLMEKLRVAEEHNREQEALRQDLSNAVEKVNGIEENMRSISSEIERKLEMIGQLQKQVDASRAELMDKSGVKNTIVRQIASINTLVENFEVVPVEPIKQEIATLQQKNGAIRKNEQRKNKQRELEESELKGQDLYRKIAAIKANRTAIMSSSEIPIDGLTIGDGCLLYPNSCMEMVRLSALSDGEFWPIACGLVASFRPRVRIVIIDNMHDLDKSNFEALCAAAEKYGMQIWIHKTLWDESGAGAGFLIRDGQVVKGPSK
jgi:hypothetical protein